MTHRQSLIAAIVTALGAIQPNAAGYSTGAGMRVYEWRDPETEAFKADELPAIAVRDVSDEIAPLDSAVHEHSLTVEISGGVTGQDAPNQTRELLADINTAIRADPTFGGRAHYCRPTQSTTDVRQSGARNAFVRLTLDVKYRTPAFNERVLHADPT